ncbi:hypothetical protein FMEAI12_2260014 [Parafrankia sp. Ea1.12]|nr:hypothetical protein FMEAI12_2260014 [Parafrankia sp. Ea1.12]
MEDDITVVAQAASGPEALVTARLHRPDVALLDLQMPGLDGIAVAQALHADLPACANVIVTSHGRPGYLRRALAAGARGFLPKTVSVQVLADVVRVVHGGGRYVDPELAAEAIAAGDSPLTPREAEVPELAAGGAPVEEIAARVSLSRGTVRNYLSSAVASWARSTGTRPSSSPASAAGSDRRRPREGSCPRRRAYSRTPASSAGRRRSSSAAGITLASTAVTRQVRTIPASGAQGTASGTDGAMSPGRGGHRAP